jgi:uncharacterized protein (TIGR03083 family)
MLLNGGLSSLTGRTATTVPQPICPRLVLQRSMDQRGPSATWLEQLEQIEQRAAAFREAVAAASDLSARVPGCPDWTIIDLLEHLGEVHRSWAAAVRAGDPSAPPSPGARGLEMPPSDSPASALLHWSAASTQELLEALREFGPERPCWTWWQERHAPRTASAVARHQVQETAVHAYDAQEAVGRPEPVPSAIALDCVDEFLAVTVGTTAARQPWPHDPAVLAIIAAEGPSWALRLASDGVAAIPSPERDCDATVRAPSPDLILALYKRVPVDVVRVDGDATLFGRFGQWLDTR